MLYKICKLLKLFRVFFSDIKGDFKGPCGICRQVFAEVSDY